MRQLWFGDGHFSRAGRVRVPHTQARGGSSGYRWLPMSSRAQPAGSAGEK